MRHQPSRTATILTLLALLCALVTATTPSVASAAPVHGAQVQQQRDQQREARRQSRLQAREARRAARSAQRAARKTEREELQAKRAAERAARSAGRSQASDTTTPGQPAPTEGAEGAPKVEGETHGGETPTTPTPTSPTTPARTTHGDCTLAASATPTQPNTGEAVTLSGTLSCPTAAEAGEQTVTVYAHERDAGAGAAILGTATTAADGTFQFHTAALTVTNTFTLQTPTARHPVRVVVPVGAAISLQGPQESGATLPMSAPREAGGPVRETFSGQIHPEQADRMVALFVRYATGEWRKLAYTRTDAEGRFSFTHRFTFAGDVSVKAGAHPHGTERIESIPLTYTVAQAQNPAVTIVLTSSLASPAPTPASPTSTSPTTPAPSSAPGAGGSATGSATISGVALDWANRTVTLLALGSDGRYTAVATVLTDATGAYSFTVDPKASTVYRVACGHHRSAPVRVKVSAPSSPSAVAPAS